MILLITPTIYQRIETDSKTDMDRLISIRIGNQLVQMLVRLGKN